MAIKFDNKAPEWDNVGAEPDAELKKAGSWRVTNLRPHTSTGSSTGHMNV